MCTSGIRFTLFVALLSIARLLGAQQSQFKVAFYNVENLFDTSDNPLTLDDEFTPEGAKAWTPERYATKLDRIGEVIAAMDFPAVLGVSEIENDYVLADLVAHERLSEYSYGHVSFDSPDLRGIDNGLLFRNDVFELKRREAIPVIFPEWLEPEGYTTRDLLYVELRHKASGEEFHFVVNHWPSRRGGVAASEHRRMWAASHLKALVGALVLDEEMAAKVIVMGDFNDEPLNFSVQSGLGTLAVDKEQIQLPGLLYNPFLALDQKDEGSYNYRGVWNMLDQIMYTGLLPQTGWTMTDFGVFKPDWLLYESRSPNKTYGGPNYYGGYSDHLPVYLEIQMSE